MLPLNGLIAIYIFNFLNIFYFYTLYIFIYFRPYIQKKIYIYIYIEYRITEIGLEVY